MRDRALLGRGVISVLVLVPVAGVVVGRVLDLPREAEVGIALMAASPGAPIALRRSIGAGGHQSFAAVLQALGIETGVRVVTHARGASGSVLGSAAGSFTTALMPPRAGMTPARPAKGRALFVSRPGMGSGAAAAAGASWRVGDASPP